MRFRSSVAGVATCVVALAGCSVLAGGSGSSGAPGAALPPCSSASLTGHYVGFSVSGFPPDPVNLHALEKSTGISATTVSIYISLGGTLDMSAVAQICAQGALPVIEIDSDKDPISDVIDGKDDAILTSYAKQVAALRYPIAIDFDHEFNGPWFHWGFKYETANQFIAAWRHLVTVFRSNGATDVKWVWNPNVSYSDTAALQPWYPGDSYVTWVGLDGYFTSPRSTFGTVFGSTLSQVRKFTNRPALIVETGASPSSQRPRAIKSLFAGAASTPGIVGLIWFDYDKATGHDWYIDNDPESLTAFRQAAKIYVKGS